MAYIPDPILDSQLDQLEGTNVHVCSGVPADYAGIPAVELATTAITGSYVKADGTPDGRQTTLPGQADLTIDTTGNATNYAVSDGASSLKCVFVVSNPQTLNSGGTVSVGSAIASIGDPTDV